MEQNNNESKEYNPAEMSKRFFRIWKPVLYHQIVLIAASIVMSFAVGMVYFSKHPDMVQKSMENQAVFNKLTETLSKMTDQYAVLATGLAGIVLIFICYRMYHKDVLERQKSGTVQKSKNKSMQYVFLAGLCISVHFVLNNVIFASNIDTTTEGYSEVQEMLYSPSLIQQLLILGIISPLCEEIIYRGLVYRRLREKNSFIKAALMSALIFAMVHGNMVQIIYAFAVGMMLSFLMEKFDNLLAPVIAHVLMNVLSISLTYAGVYDYLVSNEQILMISSIAVAGIGASFFLAINHAKQQKV